MDWYDPDEDTYTLIDALKAENIREKIVLDLGCSTGAITDILESNNLVISLDLNIKALQQLKDKNAIRSDLLKGLNQRRIDVCIFNPPYVPDFDCPILGGGKFGREIIDKFVQKIEIETFYLLVIEANKPIEIVENIKARGYETKIIKIRKIVGETIIIIKAVKINNFAYFFNYKFFINYFN